MEKFLGYKIEGVEEIKISENLKGLCFNVSGLSTIKEFKIYYLGNLRGFKACREFKEFFGKIKQTEILFFSIPPKSSYIEKVFFCWHFKKIKKNMSISVTRIGLSPKPFEANIVFELRRNILTYVELVSYRCRDSSIKNFLKKIKLLLCGTFSWKGWEFVLLHKPSNKFLDTHVFDQYTILSSDRAVVLVFDSGSQHPKYVEKRGQDSSLALEWQSHQLAFERLGTSVPKLLGFSSSEGQAAFRMEYIPEKNLSNLVSGSLFRRRFLLEKSISLLEFFHSVFIRFLDGQEVERQMLAPDITVVIMEGLDFSLDSDHCGRTLDRLKSAIKRETFPLIPQHGDFCVRNVLYRNAKEMVLIDWEDFSQISLPFVDLAMLQISLADIWRKIDGNSGDKFIMHPIVQDKISRLRDIMQKRLGLAGEELEVCNLLSFAYLIGNNLRKGRISTANRIYDSFLLQVESLENLMDVE